MTAGATYLLTITTRLVDPLYVYDLDSFDADGQVSDEERAFLSALRRQTEGRIYLWIAREGWAESGAILVGIHIDAPDLALLTLGVRVLDRRLHGDRLDGQSYVFPATPSSMAIDSEGSPEALAEVAAEWFQALSRRPIVRHEWLHEGRVYAERYVLEDTGEPLSEMYRKDWAPPGQPERLIREGHVHGEGWIQTSGLGRPDRVVPVSS